MVVANAWTQEWHITLVHMDTPMYKEQTDHGEKRSSDKHAIDAIKVIQQKVQLD